MLIFRKTNTTSDHSLTTTIDNSSSKKEVGVRFRQAILVDIERTFHISFHLVESGRRY